MKQNKFGEIVFDEDDLCDLLLQNKNPTTMQNLVVDRSINIEQLAHDLVNPDVLASWRYPYNSDISVREFDLDQQRRWLMPKEYQELDIAQYVLSLCGSDSELQRVAKELLMFQERDMFDLLRYMKYLVDVMTANNLIWGVGRGSSVSSYVLYLLGVHKINSLEYDLDPGEFLR